MAAEILKNAKPSLITTHHEADEAAHTAIHDRIKLLPNLQQRRDEIDKFLAGIPLSTKVDFTCDVISAGDAINLGVVEKTTRAREKYWMHWSCYSKSVGIDPLLEHTDPLIRDVVLTAFAARVRTGYYGRGHEIRVSGVTEAISAISKTIELAGYNSPVYRSPNVYNLSIQRLVEGYKREDPPSVPQLAVPVAVPENMADIAYHSDCPLLQAIVDLAVIAFYYLLRVGEEMK